MNDTITALIAKTVPGLGGYAVGALAAEFRRIIANERRLERQDISYMLRRCGHDNEANLVEGKQYGRDNS